MADDKFKPRKRKIPGTTTDSADKKPVKEKKTVAVKTKQLTVFIPENVFKAVKVHCSEKDLFVKDYIADLLRDEMKKKGKL